MSLQIGDTFYWKEGGHLWVVISDPTKGECVIANLTKDVFRAGKECVLSPGEHRWISSKTYVSFGDARCMGVTEMANLAKQIALGTIKMHDQMSQVTLKKIVQAAMISNAIPEGLKAYL